MTEEEMTPRPQSWISRNSENVGAFADVWLPFVKENDISTGNLADAIYKQVQTYGLPKPLKNHQIQFAGMVYTPTAIEKAQRQLLPDRLELHNFFRCGADNFDGFMKQLAEVKGVELSKWDTQLPAIKQALVDANEHSQKKGGRG